MTDSTMAKRPRFRGLSWQRNEHYSFFRPIDWYQFNWLDEREGVLFGPSPDDNATLFAVDVKDLGLVVTEDDLADLEAGYLEAIQDLSKSQIEQYETWKAGPLIGLEAKYIFEEEGQTRKRWVRVLYQDTRQITVTAQGATTEAYDYWLPMFYEQMMTFKVHSGHEKPQMPV